MGGTEILEPLAAAMKVEAGKRKKRIFLLTDGDVSNKAEVIACARQNNKLARVHTFGIGSGCDISLVEGTAKAGLGTSSLVPDVKNLSKQVITALKIASEPSFSNCTWQWSKDAPEVLGEIFRNQSVTQFKILSMQEFKSL